eukprot:gnl/MRDRNA2_/MRDRNA2_113575_c0_seq1.p1 gnl/MRDRNA2_/MRDRNA2_113575_c0~~gnl/MRDRNA2_/MRDRNA2_113575_c0_seq1.p1  ORF type:complete len:265 (+),score=34.35 gnl/MRDRNA2_/MRDRNA2_113575_c0_seq1:91-885(+)
MQKPPPKRFCVEETPVTFLAPQRPAAGSNKPFQPPGDIVRSASASTASGPRARSPGATVVGKGRHQQEMHDEEGIEEDVLHDEDFNFGQPRKESGQTKLLKQEGRFGGRPVGRYFAAIVIDLLLLVSGLMFLQEADMICQSTGKSYPECLSGSRRRNEAYGTVCLIIAGSCELIALICALLANFRKNRTFVPFIGTSIALLGIVAGFCGGILYADISVSVAGIGVGSAAFLGFATLGVCFHGGMSLRKPPPVGAAYKGANTSSP